MSSSNLTRRDFINLVGTGTAALVLTPWMSSCTPASTPPATRPSPVPFTSVRIQDTFWQPRMEINRKVTIPYNFQKCEETGRISNFAKAGGLMEGDFEGIFYNDSDVFKVIEGAAYSLALHPDPELDRYLDDLISKIAAAQEDDGYLYTARTLRPENPPEGSGPERWSNLSVSHELYNVGHLYEAAVAHYQATGKRTLLDVAIKNADLIDSVFGPGKRSDVPGHQEIEIGLVRLYRVTGDERYLNLAKFFLDERGNPAGHELYGAYNQDHVPVIEQREAVGHAVRAGYQYAGMADVAALTGNAAYLEAIDRIWENIVTKKLYITGGVGARREGEAYGDDYELPNRSAYSETCAAVANALFNHRMFLLHGDAKYIDVLERTIYNGFLSGVSLEGNRFFYPNPLESNGKFPFNHGAAERQPWFGTSCCPVNVVRFVPSIAGYVYGAEENILYVNLFVGGTAEVTLGNDTVRVNQETNYPWDGLVRIEIEPESARDFTVKIRLPGWAMGKPVPGDLYHYLDQSNENPQLSINNEIVRPDIDRGYAVLRRMWQPGDIIELRLPMPVRRVVAHPEVEEDAGRVAFERGPIVYCAEAVDNNGKVLNLAIPDDIPFVDEHKPDLLGGVTVLEGKGKAVTLAEGEQAPRISDVDVTLVPYYAWNHRGVGEMAVWFPRNPADVPPPPAPTLASLSTATASHVWRGDTITALNDQEEPGNSNDHSISRFTWWDHKGTKEWVQYDFKQRAEVAAIEVYWFDDSPGGGCRVPEAWRVLYRKDNAWSPVRETSSYGVQKDTFNRVTFEPVETDGLRLEVQLQPDFSAGILEWKVEEFKG